MAGNRQDPMSKVDTAWLRMETPTNLMMITGVMMFDRPMDIARFKRVLAERFLAFPRFRQKAVESAAGAHWETDPDFDLDWHVRITALPGEAGQKELQHLVSQLASTPLDHSKPLWQYHVVERYQGGSALIMRIHHCYADGLALVQVMLSLTDTELKKEKVAPLTQVWLKEDRGGVLDRLLEPARAGFSKAVHMGERVVGKGIALLGDPGSATHLLDEGAAIAREFAHAVTLADDPPTPFKGPLGVTKRVAWMEPLDLEAVRTVGRALGCTVNDVLMASVAGALRSYLRDLDEAVDGLTIRATVPVSLRPLEHAKKLGNHFGLVFLDLPIGEPNPLRRLERIAASMREIKRSRQAVMSFGLLAVLGMGPSALQRPALELFGRKATAVATNVPGPQAPLFLAGCRIVEQMFWVPQSGSIGMGISILSYSGKVFFGLITDAKLVPDPNEIIRRFQPEFEKLLLIALMEDWEQPITAGDAAATLRFYAGDDGGSPVEGHIVHEVPAVPAPKRPTTSRKAAKRGAAAPKAAKPDTPRSKPAKPTAAKPITLKPKPAKPGTARSKASKSAAAKAPPPGKPAAGSAPAHSGFAREIARFRQRRG
jgi:WS/DGAT/MGAT family acyltransferase